ncbi:leucine-rich repeat and coiled-coil domain-containing protein 1, partial [Biomphalaria glabrata]
QAIEKLKSADNIFRQQLDLKEAAYQEKITQLELEKERELELANQKVVLVEEEMRELLRETEMNKRAMEAKLKKFTQALGDLQTDFL